MKKSLFALAVSVSLFLMGCPLQTDFPIKGEAVSIPSWMPGKWTRLKDGNPGTSGYQVKTDPSSRSKLVIVTLNELGEAGKDNEVHKAVLSRVKGGLFLSVFEKGTESEEDGYYHYAVGRSSNGDMLLTPLKEHIVSSGTSGEELAAYIAKQANDDDYLDKNSIEYYRRR